MAGTTIPSTLLVIAAVMAAVVINQISGGASAGWSTVAPMPTIRAWLAAASGTDGRVYAMGGYDNSATSEAAVLNTIDAYTPVTGTWSRVASMPTAREAMAAVRGRDGRIYTIGGDYSPTPLGTVEAYDPGTNTWATLASMPTPRTSLAAAAGPDGRLYALGGYGGASTAPTATAVSTVEVYDPATGRWSPVAPMAQARANLAAATGSDGRIYAIGGNDRSFLSSVEAYDPGTNTWTAVAPMPTGRTSLAAAALPDGNIYAVGGEVPPPAGRLGTVEAYSPTTNRWTSVAAMPTARDALAAAASSDGRLYALGGVDSSGAMLTVAEAYPARTPAATPTTSSTTPPVPVTSSTPPPRFPAPSPAASFLPPAFAGSRAPPPPTPAPRRGGGQSSPLPQATSSSAATSSTTSIPGTVPSGDAQSLPPGIPRTGDHAAVSASWLLSSLPRPQDLALSVRPVAISLGVTLVLTLGALAVMPFVGIPLVGIPLPTFPSELFDSTLDETYEKIKRRFRFLQGPVRLVKRMVEVVSERGLVASTLVALVAAGLYALLDDRFQANLHPVGVYGAALLGIVAMTFGFRSPSALYVRRRYRVKVRARALPGTLLITAACVAVSHLAHFEPGYLYGIVAGFTWSRLEGKDADHAVTRSAVGIFLATFLLSWTAWGARGFITNPEGGWALFADQLLAMIYLCGFEAMIITMLPLRFLDGRHIVAWNWKVWALLLGLGILGFVHVLIMDPRSGYLHTAEAMATLLVPLVGFGLLSVAFWVYCRSRGEFAKADGQGQQMR